MSLDKIDPMKEIKLSLMGFINYMKDPHQYVQDFSKTNEVYMDMNLSFANYFINSSHNTYLNGDQITSDSKADIYAHTIMRGARLV